MKISTNYTRVLQRLGLGLLLLGGIIFASNNPFLPSAAKVTATYNPSIVRPVAARPMQAQQPAAEQLQSQTTQSPSVADLLVKAQTDGSVRVIVGLRAGFRPEGLLENQADVQTQRLSIAQAQDSLLSQMTAFNVTGVKQFATIPFLAFEVDAAGLQFLQSSPEVVSIQEDSLQPLSLAESVPLIGAPAAWAAGYSGTGQSVAILDTGVDKAHPFLAGKVVSEACYSTTATGIASTCPGGVAASTAVDSGRNCNAPGCEHGTHVAGIAAGRSATASGVARDANLIAINVASRATGCSSGVCVGSLVSDVIRGLERVYELRTSHTIAAVNLSLGGGKFASNCDAAEPAYKAAIDNLRSVGIATIVAAGNEGYTGSLSRPACISTAISVGSTGDGSLGTTVDAISSFSNSTSFLHLLAPGEWINSSVPGGGFANIRGTSMAAPHVAGAWAVLKSKFPNASVEQVLMTMKDTGLPITDARNGITKPRIRVDAAAMSLATTPCNYTIAPTTQAFPVSGGTGSMNVISASGCAWTASSNVPWVMITAGSSGTSNGSVNFTVAANTELERTGTIFVAGHTFVVTQAGVTALAVDDGTFENSTGLGAGGNSYRVNRLTPTSYPATINAVAIFFPSGSGVRVGDALTVVAATNPSGSATIDGITFSRTNVTIQALDQFNIFQIPNLTTNSGDFVVGMQITHATGAFPFALDETPPDRQRSYRSLNGSTFALIGSVGTPGNYGIRALLTQPLVCQTVTNISPSSGLVGATVTITGTGFTGVSAVRFANNVPASYTVNSDTSLTATVPSGAVTGPITISKTGCQDVQTAVFTVQSPPPPPCQMVSGLAPTSGVVGSQVTITGVNFTGVSVVRFANNVPATFTVNSDTSITATVPSGAVTGPITISKTGCSDVQTPVFTVTSPPLPCQTVSGLTPTSGMVGSAVTITGENFAGVTALRFSNNVAASFTVNSSGTQISTTVPNGAVTGPITISKTGCTDVQTATFTVLPPSVPCHTVSGLTPTSGAVSSQVTITGTNLTGVSAVRFANNVPATFTVNSDTSITATVPSGVVTGPITISKTGCPDVQTAVFTVIVPASLQCDTVLCFADAGSWCNRLSFGDRYLNHRVVVPGFNFNQPLEVITGGRLNPLISQYLGCDGFRRTDLRSMLIAAYLAAQLDIQTQLSFWSARIGKQPLGCHVITPMSMPGMPGAPRALPATISGGPVTLLTDASSLQDLYYATDWVLTKGSMDDLQKLIAIYKQLNTCRRD